MWKGAKWGVLALALAVVIVLSGVVGHTLGDDGGTTTTVDQPSPAPTTTTTTATTSQDFGILDEIYRVLSDNFVDPDDGDVLRYSATGLPGSNSLRLDSNTGVLSGTPIRADVRTQPYIVNITATDRAGASARLSFPLTIFADNRADLELDISLAVNPINVGETARWNVRINNRGPGNATQAQLDATWSTSGPPLSLTASGPCSISGNGTDSPEMNCNVGFIERGTSMTIQVDGTQGSDGENTVIGVLSADDPISGNNTDLASSQVVEQVSEGPTQVINVSGNGVDAGETLTVTARSTSSRPMVKRWFSSMTATVPSGRQEPASAPEPADPPWRCWIGTVTGPSISLLADYPRGQLRFSSMTEAATSKAVPGYRAVELATSMTS